MILAVHVHTTVVSCHGANTATVFEDVPDHIELHFVLAAESEPSFTFLVTSFRLSLYTRSSSSPHATHAPERTQVLRSCRSGKTCYRTDACRGNPKGYHLHLTAINTSKQFRWKHGSIKSWTSTWKVTVKLDFCKKSMHF